MMQIFRKKKEELTEEDIEKVRDLYYNYNDFSDYNVEEINTLATKTNEEIINIIDGLRYLSKSKLFAYLFCPQQFKYRYIHNIPEGEIEIAEYGKNVHKVLQFLYDYIEIKDLIKYNEDITKYLFDTMVKMCTDIYSLYPNLNIILEKIAKYENFRFQNIKRIVGLSELNIKKYYFPLFREIHLRNDRLYLSGIVDSIFILQNDKILIVDYKSGKPKDLNDQYGFKNVVDEMNFYRILIEDKDTYCINDINFKLNKYKVELVQMLFLKDMENSKAIPVNYLGEDIKFKFIEYFDSLFNNNYKPRYFRNNDFCMRMCPFFNYCIKINKQFNNILELDNKYWNK